MSDNTHNIDSEPLTMLHTMLRHLIDTGKIDVPTVARAMCINPSTIYKWRSGNEPMATYIIRLIRAASVEVQHALLSEFVEGTDYQLVYTPDDIDLDIDGDGEVTVADATEFILQSLDAHGKTLKQIYKAAADGTIDATEIKDIESHCQEIARDALSAAAAARAQYEADQAKTPRRRQAKRNGSRSRRTR